MRERVLAMERRLKSNSSMSLPTVGGISFILRLIWDQICLAVVITPRT